MKFFGSDVTLMAWLNQQNVTVALAILLVPATYFYYNDPFALSGKDTAYDFMKSDVDKRVSFVMTMCNNGGCLSYKNWKCGFGIGHDREIEQCFDRLVRLVEPWEKLDRIRKHCGIASAQ